MGELSDFGKPDALTARLAQCFRDMRHQQGWSLDELTERSGVSRATLSRLEHAEVSPTAQALSRIASAYGLSVSRLLRKAEGDAPELTPRDAQPTSTDAGTGAGFTAVSTPNASFSVAICECVLPAGSKNVALPQDAAQTEHHILVLEGRVTVSRDGAEHVLRKGDSLRFHGDGLTGISTTEKRSARLLITTS